MSSLGASVQPGLTADEAAQRLIADGPNELPTAVERNLLRQAWDVVREPMLLLLLGAGTVNFALAEPVDGAILMSFVLVVIGISIYQEHKTERALTALRELSSPRALVVRDGVQVRVAGRDVVRGDCLLLAEGDRVPADAVLVDCVNFSVDESALTGEAVPVRKAPRRDASTTMGEAGGDGTPWVFSGTLVVRGHGVAEVAVTGAGTALGRIGAALRTIEVGRTRLQLEVDRLVRAIAVIGVSAALLVVLVHGLVRHAWLEGVLAGIATAMAMLPEEFPVVLTVFMALGAWRMSQHQVLTRRPPVIETLGSVSVVCVDKTGTLTMNRMRVVELVTDTGEHHAVDVDDAGDRELPEPFHPIAEFAALASPVEPFDPMDRAVRELLDAHLAGTEHVHRDFDLVREYPLSEQMLALSHVWRSPDSSRYVIATKGAPEAVADLCHLDADATAAITVQVDRMARSGQRVLGVAVARFDAAQTLPTEQHDFDFRMVGLVGFADPVRPGAADAVAECARAGVRTVMITGDHPATALAIAHEVGIDTTHGCLTGAEVAAMTDGELSERMHHVQVFARTAPDQKLQLVRALQAAGEVVAMTGDGVNDAPALRAADVGIAMGARGTDVAREAAALVLVDDDMSSIARGIRLGRGIFDNLRKAMAYIIAVHVPIIGMSMVPLVVRDWPLVLLPVQIALLELIIDPACSVVFEAEAIDPRIMEQPPRRVDQPMFDRRVLPIAVLQGLSVLLAVVGVYLWMLGRDRPDDAVRAATFATLVLSNLGLILVNRSWRLTVVRTVRERRNPTLVWILVLAGGLLAALVTVPWMRRGVGFGSLHPAEVLVAAVAGVAGLVWFEVYKLVRVNPREGVAEPREGGLSSPP
jgi:Ca2+-transporting ATPase